MKCCHCPSDVFRMVDGSGLCFSCYTALQNTSNGNFSSAYQAHQGMEVANSMLKARADFQRNQHAEHQTRNTEVNNYYTNNNITVEGDNSGFVQAGMNQTQNNNIGINNFSKSGSSNVNWLAKIIANGLEKFWMWLIGFFR